VYPKPSDCKLFSIRKQGRSGQKLCRLCYKKTQNDAQRIDRKSQSTNRTAAGSTVPDCCLSPEGIKKKMSSMTKKIKAKVLHTKRLKVSLKEARKDQLVDLGQDATAVVKQAFDFIQDKGDKSDLKKRIIAVLVESDKYRDESEVHEELEEFATRVCNLMDGECMKLAGKGYKNQVRFDFRMKRIAIAHWLAFGKSGLDSLRENSLEIIPSLRTVEREFSHLRAGGSMHCPSKCALFHDVLAAAGALTNDQAPIQILFDEIKLRSGVWYNCNTKVVHGFAASKNGKTLSFAEEILSMTDNCISDSVSNSTGEQDESDCNGPREQEGDYNGAATHANVFRARTAKNKLGILLTSSIAVV